MRKRNEDKDTWYPYAYLFRGEKTILLWRSSERGDCFALESRGKLISFKTVREAKKLLGKESRKVRWSKGANINFDEFWAALRALRVRRASSKKTCESILNGWNFIEDLLRTASLKRVGKSLRTPVLNRAYKKLFHGANLPSVTPRSRSYEPLWESEEILALRKEMRVVWQILRKHGFMKP
jgi:hypothetical protein